MCRIGADGRAVRTFGLAALLVVAGCSGLGGPVPDSDATADTLTATDVSETAERASVDRTTTQPTLSDEEAIERALSAERAYLAAQLRNASCLDEWAAGGPLSPPPSEVIERNESGVYVRAFHAYVWNRDGETADLYSTGVYRVSSNETRRLGGSSVGPCDG